MNHTNFSVLDLSIIPQDHTAKQAIDRTVELAQLAEKNGYSRVWLAEHHNMQHIASSATSVLIDHVASKTTSIRVGSGGIMLPNHSPLAIAEQFGTLETIYPGRIDLGLGRAPGTDQQTAAVLRRNNLQTVYDFPNDVRQLQRYFSNNNSSSPVRAFPGEGLNIPLWILGSSTDSAYLAAEFGLPYAFASHFAPGQLRIAVDIYLNNFKPSEQLEKPYMMACVNAIAADTEEEAQFLASSIYQLFAGILTNNRKPLMPPVKGIPENWPDELKAAVHQMTERTFIGTIESLKDKFSRFINEFSLNEVMITGNIFDQKKRLHSYELLSEVFQSLNAKH